MQIRTTQTLTSLLTSTHTICVCLRSRHRTRVLQHLCARDVIKVAVESGVVKYKKNGVVVYTSSVAPAYPLVVDLALYSTASTLANVILGSGSNGGMQVQWLVTDHLGTPRMIFGEAGSQRASSATITSPSARNSGPAPAAAPPRWLRWKRRRAKAEFTSYERDNLKQDLIYAQARLLWQQSRTEFTSVGPTSCKCDAADVFQQLGTVM
jgi:hypothetical protein